MKTSKLKLALTRETVRELGDEQRGAAGGNTTSCYLCFTGQDTCKCQPSENDVTMCCPYPQCVAEPSISHLPGVC